jgi:hypothetical protein
LTSAITVKLFGSLLGVFVAVVLLMAWITFRPSGLQQLATMVLVTLLTLPLQVAVIWSVGAEPGLVACRADGVRAAGDPTGFGVSGRMVMAPARVVGRPRVASPDGGIWCSVPAWWRHKNWC